MSSVLGYLGKVKYHVGLVFSGPKQDSFEYQTEAWKKEADCGCGIDCCEKKLVLTDQVAITSVDLFFSDGAMKFRTSDGTVYTVTAVAD